MAAINSFTEAANRGEGDDVRTAFAAEARFDSVGHIYHGREDIYRRFLGPDVVDMAPHQAQPPR